MSDLLRTKMYITNFGSSQNNSNNNNRSNNLTIRKNGICTTQNLSWWMRRTNSSGVLRQTDHLMRTCRTLNFAVLADHRTMLKESEKKVKYLDLAREQKKCGTWNNCYTNCNWCSYYSHKRILKRREDIEIRGRVEAVQTTALLRSTLRSVLET